MNEYVVIIEGQAGGYSAYVLDLPGCIAVGDTVEEVRQLIREAIPFHLEGLRDAGDPAPSPATVLVDFVAAG